MSATISSSILQVFEVNADTDGKNNRYQAFLKKIDLLNRRALRAIKKKATNMDYTPFQVIEGVAEGAVASESLAAQYPGVELKDIPLTRKIVHPNGMVETRKLITFVGNLTFNGFRVIGTYHHKYDEMFAVGNSIDGVEYTRHSLRIFDRSVEIDPEMMVNVHHRCDHCVWDRPRNTTALIYEEATGKFKQVGSTCVSNFVLSVNATTLAMVASDMLTEANKAATFAPVEYEAVYAEVFMGYMVRRFENGEYFNGMGDKIWGEMLTSTTMIDDSYIQRGKEALVWMLSDATDKSDHLWFRLRDILSTGFIPKKEVNAVCVGGYHWKKAMIQMARRAAAKTIGGFVGTVGESVFVRGEITAVIPFTNSWGKRSYTIKATVNGTDTVVWFSSKDYVIGEKVRVSGVVTKQNYYGSGRVYDIGTVNGEAAFNAGIAEKQTIIGKAIVSIHSELDNPVMDNALKHLFS